MSRSLTGKALKFLLAATLISFVLLTIRVAGIPAFSNDTVADRVLGQPDFVHSSANTVDSQSMNTPYTVAIDRSVSPNRLYVSDNLNNRVLAYHSVAALVTGGPADLVIGQPDAYSGDCNHGGAVTAYTLCNPNGLATDGAGDLYVADNRNNRVLEYNKPFATAAAMGISANLPASAVFGQGGDFTSNGCNSSGSQPDAESLCNPVGVALDAAGNLYIGDNGNNRVVEYSPPFSPSPAAHLVFGQLGSFVTNTANNGGTSANSLNGPQGLVVDSAGNLYVADKGNNRVLEYFTPLKKTAVTGSGDTTADRVFGQGGDFTMGGSATTQAGLNSPQGAALDAAGDLFAADSGNNRVLEFSPPFPKAPVAVRVFGQSGDFNMNPCNPFGVTSATLCFPAGLAIDSSNNLYVADQNNNRVMEFSPPFNSDPVAGLVLGQADTTHNNANSVDASGMNSTAGVAVDIHSTPNHLYVSDPRNNRVLGYQNAASFAIGAPADLVIGQPDFSSSGSNGFGLNERSLFFPVGLAVDGAGNLFVADNNNNRVLEFSAPFGSGFVASQPAMAVFGQAGKFNAGSCNMVTSASAGTLCAPAGVAIDAKGKLYVAEFNNNRVLEFDPPFASAPTASHVIGQSGFSGTNCNRGASVGPNTLCNPNEVALDASGGHLYVADFSNHRVVEFDTPLSNGANAKRVFGQGGNLSSAGCNIGNTINPTTMCNPAGVVVDKFGRLFAADAGNNRVLEFDSPLTSATANRVFGQADNLTSGGCNLNGGPSADSLCFPVAVALDAAANVYVADQNNNRLLEYDVPIPPPHGPITAVPSSLHFSVSSYAAHTVSAPKQVTLINNSAADLSLEKALVGIDAGDFVLTASSCSSELRARSRCTVSIAFRPRAMGRRAGALKIVARPDPGSPHMVGLTGESRLSTNPR